MSVGLRAFLSLLVALSPLSAQVNFPAPRPPSNDIRLENHVPIPMRDGVVLYADVYRPVGGGKYPVLVSRTPYSTQRFPNAYAAPVFFARRGYVFVFQDVRGRHESEGKWDPFATSRKTVTIRSSGPPHSRGRMARWA